MKIWSRFPVFRLIIPFSAGILFCISSDRYLNYLAGFALSCLGLAALFTAKNYATGKYAQRWLAGIPFYLCFIGLGYTITWVHQSIHFPSHFSQFEKSNSPTYYIITLIEPPVTNAKGFQLIGEVTMAKINTEWKPCRGNLLLFLKDDQKARSYSLGDRCIIFCKPFVVKANSNPGAFNYAEFLHGKNIWHQAFIESNKLLVIEHLQIFSFQKEAVLLRDLLLHKLEKFIHNPDELGVAGALLLGYEDWLHPELEASYSMAGVLHVLCVSGMHVGLIYAILAFLLNFMEKGKILRHVRYILLLLFLWFYAMLTGFTPSVIRASAMFSFVVAGKWLNKEANIYNLLCSSCFLLFLLNPYLITSAGFQLSFLAVCGIVFIHPLLFQLWLAPNKLLHLIWELISISIAAQITTFPLSLYLFHQFPNYFLIGNLLIIPLSTLVMYAGLLFLVTDWLPYVGWLAGTSTSIGIDWLNKLVVFIGQLPGALTKDCYFTFPEMTLIYFLMIFFFLWVIFKWRSLMFSWGFCLFVFLTLRIYSHYEVSKQATLTIYDNGKNCMLSIIDHQNAILLTDSAMTEKKVSKITAVHFMSQKVKNIRQNVLQENSLTTIALPGEIKLTIARSLALIDTLQLPQSSKNIDLLICTGDMKFDYQLIKKWFNPRLLIVDASCKKSQEQKLSAICLLHHIQVYKISEKGAFQFTLPSADN